MKKLVYIVMPILIVAALVVTGYVMWTFFVPTATPTSTKALTIYDSQKKVLATPKAKDDIYESENWTYLEIVLTEAAQIISQQESCALSEASKKLFTQGYHIYTAFDSNAFDAVKSVKNRWSSICNTACAITDLKGNLLATYSSDTKGEFVNYTQERRSPYSSFKALSVYTPAVEKGIATWSSLYQDSPYKQLKSENGKTEDWPANATGIYSQKQTTVYAALQASLNTVAVKCLADVGVSESIKFLQDSFGIPLKEEEFVVDSLGEEEVIGNIALGYLETGITPVEMAGYYQIFSNGGKYIPPKTITTINQNDGTAYYTRKTAPEQIISPGAADLMNKLLQGVVAPGGTGQMARCGMVEVAGKTGTGDNYADNWFVGITPGYSLAVWHGQHDSNQAAEMFSTAIQALYRSQPNAIRKFVTHQNLHQLAYCTHSGKVISTNCTTIDLGYYINKQTLPVCNICSKK